MMNESINLSEDYKLGYKNGQQMLAQHLLRYELGLITSLPSFITFIERTAYPDVPKGLNSVQGMAQRLQNRTSFEDYLIGHFEKHYTGTKDGYEGRKISFQNDLDRWMSDLDVQEVIDYAEQWKEHTEQYKCQSYYDDAGNLVDCTCGKCKHSKAQ